MRAYDMPNRPVALLKALRIGWVRMSVPDSFFSLSRLPRAHQQESPYMDSESTCERPIPFSLS